MFDVMELLAMSASRVLLKYSEGEEDWTEWVDLREDLDTLLKLNSMNSSSQSYVQNNVDDYDNRLKASYPEFAQKLIEGHNDSNCAFNN